MVSLRPPSLEYLHSFLEQQRTLPLSYAAVGASRGEPPPGYQVDHNRVRLGVGREVFDRACAALRRWEMFHLGWVQLCWSETPIEVGAVVAVQAPLFGVWLCNACRIVYTINETGPVDKCGFAYGTLPDHVESGEERFTVEWCHADDTVWYDVLAFSRPNHFLIRLGYPFARHYQKKFARDSLAAMHKAVQD